MPPLPLVAIFGSTSIVSLGAIAAGALLYFLPAFIAVCRGHDRWGILAVLNLLLGWTIIGFGILAIWSVTGRTARMRQDAKIQARLATHCS